MDTFSGWTHLKTQYVNENEKENRRATHNCKKNLNVSLIVAKPLKEGQFINCMNNLWIIWWTTKHSNSDWLAKEL